RLGARELEAAREVVGVLGDAHPLAATTGGGLDDHGEAHRLGDRQRFVDVFDGPRRAEHDGDLVGDHRGARGGLVAHRADLVRRGPDEGDAAGRAGLGELRVLREEAVTRVDRVGAGDLGGGDQARDAQVRFARVRRSDADVIVGEAHVQGFAVGLGVDGDRLDAEFAAGADDAQGNLAAIGDEDTLEHRDDYRASCERPLKPASDVPSMPCTRNANSAGLVEAASAASYEMTPFRYQFISDWSKD